MKIVEKKNLAAVENGIDYGATREVLIQAKGKRLIWAKGSLYWSGRGQQSYSPASLQYQEKEMKSWNVLPYWVSQTLFEGGKFSKAKLKEHSKFLCEKFNIDPAVLELVSKKHTVVLS